MLAFRLVAPHTAELRTVQVPEPGPGEVLMRVGAAGACHSDLHVLDAPNALGMPMPLTLGHENAGWVEALGAGVVGFTRGEAVAVYGIIGCGRCVACLDGRDNECRRVQPGGIGLGRDGGMAEYLIAPARQLIPIGDLDVTQAAPLTDAGLTPYHAIRTTQRGLFPGATCVVIGVGGLGHMAVQLLAATTGVRIVAVDVREDALSLAASVGAHHVVRAGPEAAAQIRAIAGPEAGGVEVVLDCVGAQATIDLARAVIATGGDIAIIGLAGGSLPVAFGSVPFDVRVTVPFWGTRRELADVIALARTGRIKAHVESYALDQAGTAYERLRNGAVQGRAVVVPGER